MKKILACLLAACLASHATSAFAGPRGYGYSGYNGYWDFRFSVGGEPRLRDEHGEPNSGPEFDAKWDAPGGGLEFNVAHRFAARGPHSGVITFGVFARGFDGNDDPDTGAKVELSAYGVQVGGGYSFWPGRIWAIEVGPELSIGGAKAKETYPAPAPLTIESSDGAYARFAFAIRNTFTFDGFQLGVAFGPAAWSAKVTYDADASQGFPGGDATYKGNGGFLNLSIGWR